MKLYVFCMTEEVLEKYYYRGDMLRRFFREWRRDPGNPLLKRQMDYITHNIPAGLLAIGKGRRNPWPHTEFLISVENDWYDIMAVEKQYWCVGCNSLSEAERTVFPLLKAMAKPFFVVSEEGMHYGWIISRKKHHALS